MALNFGGFFKTIFEQSNKTKVGLNSKQIEDYNVITLGLTANQTIANNDNDEIIWNKKIIKSNLSMHDGDDTDIIIQEDGIYLLLCQIQWNINATGRRSVGILNGATIIAKSTIGATPTSVTTHECSTIKNLNVGDIITVKATQSSGGNLDVSSSFSEISIFQLENRII